MKQPSSPQYFPALDGMRGAGIATMLLFHLGTGLASGAFLALSMFFTLSGYLIGSQLVAEHVRHRRIDFAGFWERRFRRLLPASTLALGMAALYTATLARPTEVATFSLDILASALYVPNWRFVATGQSYEAIFTSPSPVQHFWSLGVEEQFYLGLPLLVAAMLARGSVKHLAFVVAGIVLASAAAMAWLRVPGAPLGHAYYGTDARAAEMLAGVLLALALRHANGADRHLPRSLVSVVGVLALGTTLVLWATTSETQLWFYRGGALAYSLVTCALIVDGVRGGLASRILSVRPLAYVGRISYGLYVYHWPIYLAVDGIELDLSPFWISTLKLTITFFMAVLSLRLVEAPVRSMRVVIGARRWLAPPLAIALIASLSLALFVSRSEEDARMGIELDFASASPNGGRASPPDSEPGGSRPLRITLVGNSIATRVGVGLRSWGQETGRARGSVWSIPGCGLLPRGERPTRDEPDPLQVAQCEKLNERLLAWPEHALPDILVLLFGSDELVARRIEGWRGFKRPGDAVYDDWLLERYGRIVDAFTARGTRVVWLTAPCARPKRQVALLERLGMFDAPSIRHHNEELLPRLQRARASSVAIVDLFGHVCPGGEFESRFGDLEDARPDGVHFSDEGGRLLAEWLGPAVIAAAAELEVAE